MRAYGPGRVPPSSSSSSSPPRRGFAAAPPLVQDSESEPEGGGGSYSSCHISSGTDDDSGNQSDATLGAGGATGSTAAANRTWTLPFIDGHARRRPINITSPPPQPTVVVHPFGPPPPPPEEVNVFTIRPRAGSGRTSLGRRRRYDSYVSTLDLEELRQLDEELLRRAIGAEDEIMEEESEMEVEMEGEDMQSHQQRRGGGGERRGRERLCDESEPEELQGYGRQSHQQQQQRLFQRRQQQQQQGQEEGDEDEMIDIAEDDEEQYNGHEEVKNPRERHLQRQYQRQQHLKQQQRASLARGFARNDRKMSQQPHTHTHLDRQSPLRADRSESLSRGAPPPNPTFHDPKMGPPGMNPRDSEAESERRGGYSSSPRKQQQHQKQQQPPVVIRSNVSRLSFKRVGSSKSTSSQQQQEDGDGGDGGSWLYGGGGDAADGGAGANDDDPTNLSSTTGLGKRTLLYWLDQRLPRMSDEQRIARASLYLSDAIDTRPVRMKSGGKGNLFAYRLQKRAGWMRMMQGLAVFHLMLALWEPPRAMDNSMHYHDSISRHELTGGASAAAHLLGLEVILVLFFLMDCFMEIYALGVHAFFGINAPPRVLENKGGAAALQAKLWGQARFALVIVFFADVCNALDKGDHPRFSRPLRPLYLICLSETLKRWSILLVHLMGQLRDVALGTGIFLGLFSLLGLILFSETDYYNNSIPYLNFNDFLNSFVALYVLMTTQNFGALLNPAYNANPKASTPLYFFFFMAFVLIVVLFLAHLALPRVFWVYQKFQRKQAYDSRLLERLALLMTFRCLDPEKRGWIDLSSFRSMLRYARPDFFDLHTGYEKDTYCGATEHMFSELAKAHPGRIYPHEFLCVCEMILTDYYPVVPTLEPGMVASEWHQRERARFRAILSHKYTEVASMALLILTCFFLTFYGSPAVSKEALRGFSYFVIVTFTVEVSLKLWAFGPKPYLSVPSNLVDVLIVTASFFSLLAYAFSLPHSTIRESEQMANLCLVFLTLRVVRLFPKCTIFHKFNSAFRVLPFFVSSFTLCVLISYSWSMFGMAIFAKYADRVESVVASSTEDLEGWASVDNFNSFWSASVTLFQVATTYDWYRIMYLWMDLTGTAWTSLYFMGFHLVANVVVFQLTAALFIDAFLNFSGKRWMEEEEEGEAGEGEGGKRLGGREEDGEEEERQGRERDSYDGADDVRRWSQKSGQVPGVSGSGGGVGGSPARASVGGGVTASSPTPSEDLEEGQTTRRRSGGGGGGRVYQANVI